MGVVTVRFELWSGKPVTGRVVEVHVSPGDSVSPGDTLVEVEVDKAVILVESHVAGRVAEVHVSQGDTVRPGDPLVSIEAPEGVGAGGF